MAPDRERILVDGMNVLGSRPDGWWRDRPAAMERLVGRLVDFSSREPVEVEVVFDGNPHTRVAAAGGDLVKVSFAPGGPNAADRELVRILRQDPEPARVAVVSSDRRLQNSVRAAGGVGIGAGEFLRRLDSGG